MQGNSNSDAFATEGTRAVQNGLAFAASYMTSRQKAYANLMTKIHDVIGNVMKKVKEKRAEKEAQERYVAGETKGKRVRAVSELSDGHGEVIRTRWQPFRCDPGREGEVNRRHKHIHTFMKGLDWKAPKGWTEQNGSGDTLGARLLQEEQGITWIELFALFEMRGGYKKPEDKGRAIALSKLGAARTEEQEATM